MTIEAFVPLYPRGEHSYSLGRHVLHDSASRDYDARELVKPVTLVSTLHKSVVEPWDQGQIGQCTAEAALGLLMTEPFHNGRWQFRRLDRCLIRMHEVWSPLTRQLMNRLVDINSVLLVLILNMRS